MCMCMWVWVSIWMWNWMRMRMRLGHKGPSGVSGGGGFKHNFSQSYKRFTKEKNTNISWKQVELEKANYEIFSLDQLFKKVSIKMLPSALSSGTMKTFSDQFTRAFSLHEFHVQFNLDRKDCWRTYHGVLHRHYHIPTDWKQLMDCTELLIYKTFLI